jgi:hypothetical protein
MSIDKWKTGPFELPGVRPGNELLTPDGGCPTHHTCIETLHNATPDQVKALRSEMVNADIALFTALGHYWNGIARIQRAEIEDDESAGLKDASNFFRQALEQIETVRGHEGRILSIAQPVPFSAFFVRRHEVISGQTEALQKALEAMMNELVDGYYPAPASGKVNQIMTQMMAHFDYDARIEGVLTRSQFIKRRENVEAPCEE